MLTCLTLRSKLQTDWLASCLRQYSLRPVEARLKAIRPQLIQMLVTCLPSTLLCRSSDMCSCARNFHQKDLPCALSTWVLRPRTLALRGRSNRRWPLALSSKLQQRQSKLQATFFTSCIVQVRILNTSYVTLIAPMARKREAKGEDRNRISDHQARASVSHRSQSHNREQMACSKQFGWQFGLENLLFPFSMPSTPFACNRFLVSNCSRELRNSRCYELRHPRGDDSENLQEASSCRG